MGKRIEVRPKIADARAVTFIKNLASFGHKIDRAEVIDVYTVNKELTEDDFEKISGLLTNPVTEEAKIGKATDIKDFEWAVEIGYLPGVTDNIANTAKEEIQELLGIGFSEDEGVYSSRLFFIKGKLTEGQIRLASSVLHNPLIQRAEIKSQKQYKTEGGMGVTIPKVKLDLDKEITLVDLDVSDEELIKIGKAGIANKDGSRRGPLALDFESMKVIRNYFKKLGRKPKDIELESIAQTWSEHCKHTIFAAAFDEIKDGLYKGYIKRATKEIRAAKGKDDICVSVFTDNSGAIIFDEDSLITDKVETHNSPSALDPFGGAITGIVGVNRDTIGFGQAGKPVINRYGFCFADPRDERPLYKGENKTQKMLTPRKIMEGVVEGVNVGGNCSGIPSPQGFVCFNDDYRGKPLVFVGTIGLIPREVNGKDSTFKEAQDGDLIVMVGGRVGADGIHGATFSSEAMDSGSPATAVQIGDPITQKKLSDAIVKEARDMGLYTSITDNGAGGISCSVAEMAKETNGCVVELDKVPLKYPGLSPWEIWVSESQERMTLAVPEKNWEKFKNLMDRRGVEATVIGRFNNSGHCIVNYEGKELMDIEMEFLHEGLPEKTITSTYTKEEHAEPNIECPADLTQTLKEMLARLNISSYEFISKQYDHEVQAGSVIKPLLGSGRVNGLASVTRPRLDSQKGVVLSQALYPSYSAINTYHMAACAIDEAIRNAIAVGGDLDHLALLDNFCWCSSTESERLGQLKSAVKACYDYSTLYGTPFISGKDSMFNDFVGYDENGEKIKISVPPTLLVSSIGVVEDSAKAVDLVPKFEGDIVYLIGETKDELGGSEYFAYLGEKERGEKYIGNNVPKVDGRKAKKIYQKVSEAIKNELLASALSLGIGGLGAGLSKMVIASGLGLDIDLPNTVDIERNDYHLFSESQSRLVVTVSPKNKKDFEKLLAGVPFTEIGKVTGNGTLVVKSKTGTVVKEKAANLEVSYKETLRSY
jgi:phosphoribosylformylglycinamidine synthase